MYTSAIIAYDSMYPPVIITYAKKIYYSEVLFVLRGINVPVDKDKNCLTSSLKDYKNYNSNFKNTKIIHIGGEEKGFNLTLLENSIKNNFNKNLKIKILGLIHSYDSEGEFSLNIDGSKTPISYFFQAIRQATNNNPVEILLTSCNGAKAIKYINNLAIGSKLFTLSNIDQETYVQDMCHPGFHEYSKVAQYLDFNDLVRFYLHSDLNPSKKAITTTLNSKNNLRLDYSQLLEHEFNSFNKDEIILIYYPRSYLIKTNEELSLDYHLENNFNNIEPWPFRGIAFHANINESVSYNFLKFIGADGASHSVKEHKSDILPITDNPALLSGTELSMISIQTD